MRTRRESCHPSSVLARTVRARAQATLDAGERIDVLTFVPDGEPTLDIALGHAIRLLRPLGIPIAVFTNASLLTHLDVWSDLDEADVVSLKVDTVREATWRRINRPHGSLRLADILEGMSTFARGFSGTLLTETMMVDGINDAEDEVRDTAAFVAGLGARTSYLAVPTRPPAEPWVRPASGTALTRAYHAFNARVPRVELLLGYEGDAFTSTGDPIGDLLGVTTVHPMREAAVRRMLRSARVPWSAVTRLVRDRQLVTVRYGGHRYYVRPPAVPRGRPPTTGEG
jgi:wyosine [tRNA(Phe)-imidazoG37] synthetase (radical SAM superfamily)